MDAHMFFNQAVISRPKRKNRPEKMLEWVLKGSVKKYLGFVYCAYLFSRSANSI